VNVGGFAIAYRNLRAMCVLLCLLIAACVFAHKTVLKATKLVKETEIMRKQNEEYRANMLKKLKKKYGDSNPPEVLEAEKVIANYREKKTNAIAQINRLESSECPESVCCECFYMQGLNFQLKSINGGENFDSFRCPECGTTYNVNA
jgi:hypothetical protein